MVAVLLGVALAQARDQEWSHEPVVTVLSAPDDPRIGVVDQTVDFWNHTFESLGSPFRIGPIAHVTGAVPADELSRLSDGTHFGSWVHGLDAVDESGIVVVLSPASFISFTTATDKGALVGIKSGSLLERPNVLQNVIAHELGHAIGLEHNADPTTLMCGRPADCRPDKFESTTPHYFPLTDADTARLRALYPAGWTSSP